LKELQNFVRKYSLTVFKYRQQNISSAVTLISAVTDAEVTFADRTMLLSIRRVQTMQLLTRETSDFIAPTLLPANSPELNPVNYQIWGSCMNMCTAGGLMTSPS